ncbi:MAG: hypothetical protein B5M52_07520 [Helicobacteraceae bacterium 4484_230]|nr:MAG: hypothetical protein B5M52_07520 [Helicobacteraceae bacterium 4484_230]
MTIISHTISKKSSLCYNAGKKRYTGMNIENATPIKVEPYHFKKKFSMLQCRKKKVYRYEY